MELFFDEDLLEFDRVLFEEDLEPDFLTLPFDFPDFDDRDLAPDLDVDDFEDPDFALGLEAPFERDDALGFGVARDFEVALDFEVARDFDVALGFEVAFDEAPLSLCMERERSLLIPRISRFTTGSRFSNLGVRFIIRLSPDDRFLFPFTSPDRFFPVTRPGFFDRAAPSLKPLVRSLPWRRSAGRRPVAIPTPRLRPDSPKEVVTRRVVRALSRSSLWNGTFCSERPTDRDGRRDSRTLFMKVLRSFSCLATRFGLNRGRPPVITTSLSRGIRSAISPLPTPCFPPKWPTSENRQPRLWWLTPMPDL